jgi:hypothetical protein
MRPFHLDSSMKTMGGKFYPTGWMVLMLPGERDAQEAARKLAEGGIADTDVMMITPEQFRTEVLDLAQDDAILPSAGTEGDTVRQFATYAMRGHHALMVHAPDTESSDRVVELLRECPIAYGQRYRKLVIEDIVEPTLPG